MNVFVAGATGVLGRRAVKLLLEAGHEVTGVSRSDEKAELLRSLGATPVGADLFDPDAVKDAVAGHNVVMNLATHIPPPSKAAFPGAWVENDRIRTEASRNLVNGAIAGGAERYIQESIAFFYPDTADRLVDESTEMELPEYAASTTAAETNAMRFSSHGTAVVLRFGMFYAADTTHTKTQMRTAKLGFSPFFSDSGYQSMIHMDDAASAVVASLSASTGVWNVVDDEPMLRADAAALVAEALGKKKLRVPPKAMLKMGGNIFAALVRSQRVSNTRFKEATGWQPRYPSFREGVKTIV